MTRSSRRTITVSTRRRRVSKAGETHRRTPITSGSLRTLEKDEVASGLRRLIGGGDPRVLWRERGDQVLIYAADIEAEIANDEILVIVPVETTETGRAAMKVPLALAPPRSAEMTGLTTDAPSGPPILAGRWGPAIQDAVFDALVELAHEQARDGHADLRGMRIRRGRLELRLGS